MKRYIKSTEYVDVYDLGNKENDYKVKPKEVYDLLKKYEGRYKNLDTGWIGNVTVDKPEVSDYPIAMLFKLNWNDECDYIYLFPKKENHRSCIMYVEEHGIPKFADSIKEFKGILYEEFKGFKKI